MKRDKNIIKTTEKWLSGTIIFEEIKSKRIPVKGQSSDWNNELNNNVTIFGNVSFGRKLISFIAVLNIDSTRQQADDTDIIVVFYLKTCCFLYVNFRIRYGRANSVSSVALTIVLSYWNTTLQTRGLTPNPIT